MEKTTVVFRKYKEGDIIALFAEEPADCDGIFCSCYQHIGQHGSADYGHAIRTTKPAKPEEYADLKAELERMGYNLEVRQKYYPNGRGTKNPARIRAKKTDAWR